jgi:hypothetical protein
MNATALLDTFTEFDRNIATRPTQLLLYGLGVSLLCSLIVSMYFFTSTENTTYPYDLDGWGHLVETLVAEGGRCDINPMHSYVPERGVLVPYIFTLSYCVMPFAESVQVINGLFHIMSCFLIIYIFAKQTHSFVTPAIAVLLWTLWPAYSFLHGFYFAEQISAFALLLCLFCLHKIFTRPQLRKRDLILCGLSLSFLLHTRPSGLGFILIITLFMLWFFRKNLVQFALISTVFLSSYSVLPWMHYQQFAAFVPTTTQGGYALFLGNYLPTKGAPADNAREFESFQEIEAQAQDLNAYERDRYYKALAVQNFLDAPVASGQLLVRKSLKYWVQLKPGSWQPTFKSAVFGLPLLLLWIWICLTRHTPLILLCNLAIVCLWGMHTLVHAEYRYSYVTLPLVITMCASYVYSLITGSKFVQTELNTAPSKTG